MKSGFNGLRPVLLLLYMGLYACEKQDCDKSMNQAQYDNFLEEVRVGNYPTVKELLTKFRCKPDITSGGRLTPLMIAAENGHVEVAEELLRRGATVDQKDASGCTALMFAAQSCQPRVAELLIEHGAYTPMKETRMTETNYSSIDLAKASMEAETNRYLPCQQYTIPVLQKHSCRKVIQLLETSKDNQN